MGAALIRFCSPGDPPIHEVSPTLGIVAPPGISSQRVMSHFYYWPARNPGIFNPKRCLERSVPGKARRTMVTTPGTSLSSLRLQATGRWFYAGMAGVAILFCIAAFGPSMLHTAGRVGPVSAMLAAHGVVFFAWLLLFLTQSILARTGRLALHRRLGAWSAILAAAMVLLGYITTIAMARRGFDLSGDLGIRSDPLAGIAFPLLDILMFAVLFVAACLYRKRAAIHKRLMLLAVFGALIPPPVAHLTGHFAFFHDKGFLTPVIIAAFLAASAVYDRITLGRIHPISLWVALAIFAIDNLCFAVVMPSAAWHSFAANLVH